jgi:hypothetical protein
VFDPSPRGFWLLFIAGPATMIALVAISVTTERPWLATAGFLVFGLSWAARQTLLIWMSSEATLRRIAAVLQPASFVLGGVAAAATGSGWWVLGGGVVYLSILPLADAVERRRGQRSTSPGSLPRSGDTRQ